MMSCENCLSRDKRISAEFGKFAEQKAVDYLVSKGYAIRERNWRCGKLEIDIIAQNGTTIVFVEVKGRSGEWDDPEDAVTVKKMRRISNAADSYLRNLEFDFFYRFDIIAIKGSQDEYELEHYEDAFIPPLTSR